MKNGMPDNHVNVSASADLPFQFRGVMAAVVTPFDAQLRVDIDAFARVVDYVIDGGCTGVVVGGHTGEFSVLTASELATLVKVARARAAGRVAVIQGVYSESTAEAVERGMQARANGADAMLLMPPWVFGWGADVDVDVIEAYFATVTNSVAMPTIAFCYGPTYGFFPSVVRTIAQLKHVVGIKLGGPLQHYEACVRAVDGAATILCCADSSLYPCLAVGGDGAIVGLASIAPHWCVELYDAICADDGRRARELNDAFFPLSEAIYGAGFLKAPIKIKAGLATLGVLDHAQGRPPLLPLSQMDRRAVVRALQGSGLQAFIDQLKAPAGRRGRPRSRVG